MRDQLGEAFRQLSAEGEVVVVETLIWAGVVLVLGGLLIGLGSRLIQRQQDAWIELRRREQSLLESEKAVELLERRNAADLDEKTKSERVALKQAELRRAAAEQSAATEVAQARSTVEARIKEEVDVTTARAEGRAAAAKERAFSFAEPDTDGRLSHLGVLCAAYERYLQSLGEGTPANYMTFDYWIGNVTVSNSGAVSLQD